jgi:hypothetical protein
VAVNPIRKTLDFLAKMGLTVRDDPPKVIDVGARVWGEVVDDFALSIEQIPDSLSVVLRNIGASPRTLAIPGWLAFFKIEIGAPLTPFGRELLKPERQTERINRTVGPGELVETQIPIGSLFVLKQAAAYRTQVSCTLPDGQALLSNTISIAV